MSIITKASAKNYFLTGAFPTQAQFGDTIDSYLGLGESGSQTVQGAVAFQAGVTVSGNSNFINGVKVSGNQIGNAAYNNTGTRVIASAGNLDIANTAVSAGTYTNPTVTFDATGRATSASSGSSSSAMTLLSTSNASGASSVAFDSSVITSTYNKYVIEFDGIFGSAAAADLLMTLSTNNGSTYLSASYVTVNIVSDGGTVATSSNGTANFNLTGARTVIAGTTLATGSAGTIKFASPAAAAPLMITWHVTGNNNASANIMVIGSGQGPGTTAINNIKLALSTGTITGNFHLYGISGV